MLSTDTWLLIVYFAVLITLAEVDNAAQFTAFIVEVDDREGLLARGPEGVAPRVSRAGSVS